MASSSQPPGRLQLFVKCLTGRTLTISYDWAETFTIRDIQRQVASKTGIPVELQRLLYIGKYQRFDGIPGVYMMQGASRLIGSVGNRNSAKLSPTSWITKGLVLAIFENLRLRL